MQPQYQHKCFARLAVKENKETKKRYLGHHYVHSRKTNNQSHKYKIKVIIIADSPSRKTGHIQSSHTCKLQAKSEKSTIHSEKKNLDRKNYS